MVNMGQPNGHTAYYGYDSFGRLAYTRDSLGILQRYRYNYRSYHSNDGNPDETPDTTYTPDTTGTYIDPDLALTVITTSCVASVYANSSINTDQKTFTIEWPQNVTIRVLLTTQQSSTWLSASVNKVSNNGTDIYNVYNCYGNNQTIDTSYTVFLTPGTYQVRSVTSHHNNDTSTRAYIQATFQAYQEHL